MKHVCSICNKVFKKRDAVIKISPAVIENANAAYISLDESFDDEDIIHSNCLRNYIETEKPSENIEISEDTEIMNRVTEFDPRALKAVIANSSIEPIRNDQVDNAIAGLKTLGVSHTKATDGVEKMLKENPNLKTQEILTKFPYGD